MGLTDWIAANVLTFPMHVYNVGKTDLFKFFYALREQNSVKRGSGSCPIFTDFKMRQEALLPNIIQTFWAVLVLGILCFRVPECGATKASHNLSYPAISCRKHTAVLTQFGAVGDGKTSNTQAFKAAIDCLSKYASDGGALLIVPPGRWLTGSINLTSNFTLFLDKGAVILASQNESEWALLPALPSYGRGRGAAGGRYISLIFGTNLTDVIITGNNGTIDGQGLTWWNKYQNGGFPNVTLPRLVELVFCNQIQISNLTLINSPSYFVHPTYCSNVLVQWITILAPVTSPSTDGINPDSCTNTRIQDCYIVSGGDCTSAKSGWDHYGIRFGMPTNHLIIRRLTCISAQGAAISLGSEMSGGIQDVRAEDISAMDTQSGIRIKTAAGRGAYIKDIYVRRMTLLRMRYVFVMKSNYDKHPDAGYDPKALPEIQGINYRDVVADKVNVSARLEGLPGDTYTGICISNVTINLSLTPEKLQWNCSDIAGVTSNVTPEPCSLLPKKVGVQCPFPEDRLPIDDIQFKTCVV